MRKLICTCLLILGNTVFCFGQLASKTDVRFELTSIVCRLAGYEEYMDCRVPDYAGDIDEYFAPFTQHPAVKYLSSLRESDEIAFNAISSLAYTLEIKRNKITLRSEYELCHRENESSLVDIDWRWKKKTLNRFLDLLNDFYRESNFEKFYAEHQALYEKAQNQMDKISGQINCDWFENFYGEAFGKPEIYISLCNGPHNYALTSKSGYGIIIGCSSTEEGQPAFSYQDLETIIHELNHRFANPIAFSQATQMQDAVARIYPYVKEQLNRVAYNDEAILPEWFTRLFTIMYFKVNDARMVPYMIVDDCERGFIWQDRAVAFMENFHSTSSRTENIHSFIPQLVLFFNYTADQIDRVVNEYKNRHPYVVNVYPALGSTIDTTASDPIEFHISFSESMSTNSHGLRIIAENFSALDTPIFSAWANDRTYVIRIPREQFEVARIEGFVLRSAYFQNVRKYPMKEDFKAIYKNENL